MKKYTLEEFFEKMSWEGSFEDMASYAGLATITDSEDFNNAWNTFVNALYDLRDIHDDWQLEHPEAEED